MTRRSGFQPHNEVTEHRTEMDELTQRMRSAAAQMRAHCAGSAEVEDRNRRLALAEGAALQEEMKSWQHGRSSRSPRANVTTTPA